MDSFNKASRIIHHSQGLELVLHYGPDEQRIKTEYKINGQPTLTHYFPGGGLEVEVDANGQERWHVSSNHFFMSYVRKLK